MAGKAPAPNPDHDSRPHGRRTPPGDITSDVGEPRGVDALPPSGSNPRRMPPMPAKRSMNVKAGAADSAGCRLSMRCSRKRIAALRGAVSPRSHRYRVRGEKPICSERSCTDSPACSRRRANAVGSCGCRHRRASAGISVPERQIPSQKASAYRDKPATKCNSCLSSRLRMTAVVLGQKPDVPRSGK